MTRRWSPSRMPTATWRSCSQLRPRSSVTVESSRSPERAPADVAHLTGSQVTDIRADHGEGPCWDDRSNQLLWVDQYVGLVRVAEYAPSPARLVRVGEFDVGGPIGAIVPAASGGWMLVALDGFSAVVGRRHGRERRPAAARIHSSHAHERRQVRPRRELLGRQHGLGQDALGGESVPARSGPVADHVAQRRHDLERAGVVRRCGVVLLHRHADPAGGSVRRHPGRPAR